MESVLFCVMHHSTCSLHTEVFDLCISSIRKYHPENRILVCYTSVSKIPNHMLEYENVTYKTTPLDGTHIYGAMKMLVDLEGDGNYILMHDSMVLRKSLPEIILDKRFYYLWYFNTLYHQFYDNVVMLISNTNFSYNEKCELLNKYNTENGKTWIGLFGPAFGGKLEILRMLWEKLNVGNLENHKGKDQIMMAERFIPLVATYMKIVDIFPNTVSLNDSIEKQPCKFTQPNDLFQVNNILGASYDNSYMSKIWLMRQ